MPMRGTISRALEPFVELVDGQAADHALISQPARNGIPLKVTRAKPPLSHLGRI